MRYIIHADDLAVYYSSIKQGGVVIDNGVANGVLATTWTGDQPADDTLRILNRPARIEVDQVEVVMADRYISRIVKGTGTGCVCDTTGQHVCVTSKQ